MPYPSPNKRRPLQKTLTLFLAILACTAIASAAPAPPPASPPDPRNLIVPELNRPIDLAAAFLVHPGDDPAFASPTFDDASWQVIAREKSLNSLGIRNQDYVWYRLHVHIPPHTPELSFLLRGFTGSLQIYVNGVETGPARSFAGGGAATPNFDLTAPIPDSATQSGSIVIAIRAYIHNGRHSLSAQPGFSASSALLLGNSSVIQNQLTLDSFFNYTSNVSDLFFTIFTLVITLTLWFALRKEREYLYLAVYLVGSVISEFVNILQSRYDLTLSRTALCGITLVNVVSLLAGLEFARIVFRLPRRRWIITYEAVISALILFSGAVNLFTRETGAPPLPVLWSLLAVYVLTSASLGLGLPVVAIYTWRRTRNFDALLIAIPILARGLVFYLYIGYDVFSILRYGAVRQLPNPPLGRFGVSWSEITDFVFMLALLFFLILRTVRLARARAVLAAEIAAAQSVQQLLLARSTHPTPGFLVETAYHPASEVGGDFFLISTDPAATPDHPGALLIIVGDVSGKGLSAAMRVAMILGVLRRETSREPATILANLNHALLTDDGSNDPASQPGFTTACCLHLTPTGDYTLANAGHISPYLCQSDPATPATELIAPPALPLGLAPDQLYLTDQGRTHRRPAPRPPL